MRGALRLPARDPGNTVPPQGLQSAGGHGLGWVREIKLALGRYFQIHAKRELALPDANLRWTAGLEGSGLRPG